MFRLQFIRFLVAGGVNTIFSLGVYWLLLDTLSYFLSYTISFALGILSGYALNTYFVFKSAWSWWKLMAFPLVHAVNYLAGMGVVWAAIEWAGVDQRIAPILAAMVVVPVNYILTRALIARRVEGG